jgi:hypothetical protein
MAQIVTTKQTPTIKINSHSGMGSSRVVDTRMPTGMFGCMDNTGNVRRMLRNREVLIKRG